METETYEKFHFKMEKLYFQLLKIFNQKFKSNIGDGILGSAKEFDIGFCAEFYTEKEYQNKKILSRIFFEIFDFEL